jgi:hypothetical protein
MPDLFHALPPIYQLASGIAILICINAGFLAIMQADYDDNLR